MNQQIIFIDVDGTLCNDYGRVPESAGVAIHKARQNGHKVYLCTGRSKAEITDEIKNIEFDGFIGAGGGYIEEQGKLLLHKKFDLADLSSIVRFFKKEGIGYYLESNDGLFASDTCIPEIRKQIFKGLNKTDAEYQKRASELSFFFDLLLPEKPVSELTTVNKISFMSEHVPFEKVKNAYQDKFTILHTTVPLFGENSGEIVLRGINKEVAIRYLLTHLNASPAQTIAIGDGMNDFEMLQFVNYGVAMGNAKQELKNIADFVTGTPDEDGIANFFKQHGLT
ncbi:MULTISPECIES: Cof-type HAD-IIB family hydrolase [Listeria]|uniref:Cof-type HAD-IIB family hydrolase n=1 Tax=Listeria TaxID=1637 RepID=UPI000B592253|nr:MULTISPECIES: Cof-type HAD-IIB family hydrolase [Listeria]